MPRFFKLNNDNICRLYKNITMSELKNKTLESGRDDAKWLDLVVQQVRSLRFGVVEIIVHDSRVIQIEKTEKLRLDKPPGEQR